MSTPDPFAPDVTDPPKAATPAAPADTQLARLHTHEAAIQRVMVENADPLQWTSVLMLNKQIDTNRTMPPDELFLRVAKAFDPEHKDRAMIRLNANETAVLRERIGEFLTQLIF